MNRFDEFFTAEDTGSRFLPTEDDVRRFAVKLLKENADPRDNNQSQYWVLKSALFPPDKVSNVQDLGAGKKDEYKGADLYIYRTRNQDYCKIGFSADHSRRTKSVAARIRQDKQDWYFEYVWHKRFLRRSHAILIEQALKRPLSRFSVQPVSDNDCLEAGVVPCGEIFRSSDIDKIKRRIELLWEKLELLPHKEISFCKEQNIFRGPCSLLINVRSGEMQNATICNLTTAEVKPFHEKEYELAIKRGEQVFFVNWRAWSESSQFNNEIASSENDQPQIPDSTAGLTSHGSCEVEKPSSAGDPLEEVSLRRLASALLHRVFR